MKENIKALRHWPLCGEFTRNRWIPRKNDQLRGKCFHLVMSSCQTGLCNRCLLDACLSRYLLQYGISVIYHPGGPVKYCDCCSCLSHPSDTQPTLLSTYFRPTERWHTVTFSLLNSWALSVIHTRQLHSKHDACCVCVCVFIQVSILYMLMYSTKNSKQMTC